MEQDYKARVDVVFPEAPRVSLVMANGYVLGRFIEKWVKSATSNETHDYKLTRDVESTLEDLFNHTSTFSVILISNSREAVITAGNELKAIVEGVAETVEEVKQEDTNRKVSNLKQPTSFTIN